MNTNPFSLHHSRCALELHPFRCVLSSAGSSAQVVVTSPSHLLLKQEKPREHLFFKLIRCGSQQNRWYALGFDLTCSLSTAAWMTPHANTEVKRKKNERGGFKCYLNYLQRWHTFISTKMYLNLFETILPKKSKARVAFHDRSMYVYLTDFSHMFNTFFTLFFNLPTLLFVFDFSTS